MSWQIRSDSATDVLLLEGELGIQNAAEFYDAVLPLAVSGKALRVDASATTSIHTSFVQILWALSAAIADFRVSGVSEEFRKAELRVGLAFARTAPSATTPIETCNSEAPYG